MLRLLGLCWDYVGIMENSLETTGIMRLYRNHSILWSGQLMPRYAQLSLARHKIRRRMQADSTKFAIGIAVRVRSISEALWKAQQIWTRISSKKIKALVQLCQLLLELRCYLITHRFANLTRAGSFMLRVGIRCANLRQAAFAWI